LEKQKFGGGQPKKKGGVAEAGDSLINAMSLADLAKAVSAPIGEGGSPDNPPEYLTPDNSRLMLPSYPPKFQNITTGEITSEALTPLPDSPEEAGTKAVEQVVKDVEVKKEKPASAMEEMVKAFAKPEKKEEPAKEEKATESPMKGVYFNSPTLGTVVSGLKRKAGLGAK
jgi:hypothetical protein